MASATGGDSLAEWSQKIRNLQQQTDEDGLQEQARLEAEIAKSRMERANRRSTLTGNARVDQATASYLSKLPDRSPELEPRIDALQTLQGISDAPRSLPDEPRGSTPTPRGSSSQASGNAMSLAEFMGGRAAGPRLNKHAPQSVYDEHVLDYENRSRAGAKPLLQQMANPSPVALHGLASNDPPRKSPTPNRIQTDVLITSARTPEPKAPRARSSPNQTPPTSRPVTSSEARNRGSVTSSPFTLSGDKPVLLKQISPATSLPVSKAIEPLTPAVSLNSSQGVAPTTTVSVRWTSATSPLPKSPPANPSPSNSSPRIDMLARPVQPSPPPVQRFIPATNPSPAFLKPGPPKEERPSITRLQGRGFVEKQVKASARLSSTPEEAAKVQRPTTAEKKLSVLERWPGGGQKNSSPRPVSVTPTTSSGSEVPKRDFRHSLPPGTTGASVGPMRVAAFVAATNDKNAPRARNPEHDSTPLRLPGMGNGAGPLPFKSRSQPDPAKEREVAGDAPSLGSIPRHLPGSAADLNTPSALKKSSSSTDLRTPSKRRSVHFDDVEAGESLAPKISTLDGNQTDTANTKKLVHMTKDRARKPRKVGVKSGLSLETSKAEPADEPTEPAKPEEKKSTSLEQLTKNASQTSPPETSTQVNTAPTTATAPPSQTRPDNTTKVTPPATPVTPVSARPSSREGRAKLPPPVVAPKPAALRRNSLPTPEEKNAPSFARQPPGGVQPDKSPASGPSPGTRENENRTGATLTEEVAFAPISVKAAASSWGKPVSGQGDAEKDKPQLARKVDVPKETTNVSDPSPNHAAEPLEPPPIVVPAVLNPPVMPMPQPRPRPLSQSSSERRRSISNRYSAIILPPLKEEKTPTATPEGSLRIQTQAREDPPSAQALYDSLASAATSREPSSQEEKPQTLAVLEPAEQKINGHSPISPLDRMVSIAHEDVPVPAFNLSRLLASVPATPKLAPGTAISVETFMISGSSSMAIKGDMHVFYDGEITAVVYRGKNKTTGLVGTTVWAWIGSKASVTEKEAAKLQDTASRFNTSLVQIPQGKEPYDLVQLLGGTIAIRHGSRSHWSPDNTALHCVRMHGSHFVIIEEIELTSRNICSAFSYCLTILDALFVWHGRGTLQAERSVAQTYAKSIASEGVEPTELEEGEEDDMFWMMLDEGGYANADYWRFRSQLPPHMAPSPRLWNVSKGALQPVIPFCALDLTKDSVLMYDGVFELFVIVGEDARGRREDIRLAVAAAESVAAASAVTRSFPPPMHVLIFPTRVPVDLRANFRGMDQREADGPTPPDHINLLTLDEAQSQLNQQEWTLRQLKDPQFLPLAISPSMHLNFNDTL